MPNPKEAALPIHDMASRHPGLTTGIASSLNEAARVCLSRHHDSPTGVDIHHGGDESTVSVDWQPPTTGEQRAFADSTRTTELGAEACALAAVELTTGLIAVERSRRGTGADYLVGDSEPDTDDAENLTRLEIAGRDSISPASLERLLDDKTRQVVEGHDDRPGFAAVVGFNPCAVRIGRQVTS